MIIITEIGNPELKYSVVLSMLDIFSLKYIYIRITGFSEMNIIYFIECGMLPGLLVVLVAALRRLLRYKGRTHISPEVT